ncbi:hypothetical protein [Rhizobium sp. JAB6]|uniref:hypothetical protein n=1 Tax=Rhizobium sp. JAB6 TaxID=2127050 RepID=UPI001FE15482|nr:hypothetical protein [Rhizobium sp. JAB6]
MVKQTKPFIIEIKASRRMKAISTGASRSIWGELAADLKQTLAMEQEPQAGSFPQEVQHKDGAECPDSDSATLVDRDEAMAPQPSSRLLEKWLAKKAERPKAGSQDVVEAFLARLDQQKMLLAECQSDPDGFKRWRSAWFRKVPGGFGVSIGHDLIDAGDGLRYVIVDTLDDLSRFLDDLGHHARTDLDFRRALEANRRQRAARLSSRAT